MEMDNKKFKIRTSTNADSEFLGNMVVEAFESKFVHTVGSDKLPEMIDVMIADHRDIIPEDKDHFYANQFVAEYNGESAGVLALRFAHDREPRKTHGITFYIRKLGLWRACRLSFMYLMLHSDGGIANNTCYIDHIAVSSRWRGQGVGKLLMDEAESVAKRRHCKKIFLWVAANNRAKKLYERQGYSVTEDFSSCFLYLALGMSNFLKMEKDLA